MKSITLLLLMLSSCAQVFAQTRVEPVVPGPPAQAAPPAAAAAPSAGSIAATPNTPIVIPRDTTIPMILLNTINTRSAYVGQSIYCESIYPITSGNRIIIPKGTSIRGTVTRVVRPGHIKGRAQLGLRFDELILPNGTTRHLRATLAGFGSAEDDTFKPKEGQIQGGGSKGKDAQTVAETTIPGAEIGTIVGATKGAPLEGLGIGSAAGAAAGVAWILATRGKEIVLEHGTSLDLQLLQPVNFQRDEIDPPSKYDTGPALPRDDYTRH